MIDGRRIACLDELLGLARQCDDVVSDDADANVVKVVVDKVRDVQCGFRQRMAFIATTAGVKELPAALGRFIDRVRFTGDEVIKGRIKG